MYDTVTRSPSRPRGKWHLLASIAGGRTICDEPHRGWDRAPRTDIDALDICANCLRQTP